MKGKSVAQTRLAQQAAEDLSFFQQLQQPSELPSAENNPQMATIAVPVSTRMPPQEQETKSELERLLAIADTGKPAMLPLDKIVIEDNVREDPGIGTESFEELVESIKTDGLEQGILVALKIYNDRNYKLVVVLGQRRYLAMKQLGYAKINGIVRKYTNVADLLCWGLTENLTRQDLHPFDLGRAYRRLMEAGWTQKQIEEKWKSARSHGTTMISRLVTASRFPIDVQKLMRQHPEIFNLTTICNEFAARRQKLYPTDEALREAAIAKISNGKRPDARTETTPPEIAAEIAQALNLSSGALNTQIKGTRQKGKLVLSWRNEDEYIALLNRLRHR